MVGGWEDHSGDGHYTLSAYELRQVRWAEKLRILEIMNGGCQGVGAKGQGAERARKR